MSRWTQIHRHFSLHALLIGFLYGRWLRLRRRLGYWLGTSRRWQTAGGLAAGVRIVE